MANELLLTGKLLECNVVLPTGRMYSKKEMVDVIHQFKVEISNAPKFGTISNDASAVVGVQNISHRIVDVYMEGNSVYCTISVLDTPKGNFVSSLFDANVPMKLLPMVFGKIEEKSGIQKVTPMSIASINVSQTDDDSNELIKLEN